MSVIGIKQLGHPHVHTIYYYNYRTYDRFFLLRMKRSRTPVPKGGRGSFEKKNRQLSPKIIVDFFSKLEPGVWKLTTNWFFHTFISYFCLWNGRFLSLKLRIRISSKLKHCNLKHCFCTGSGDDSGALSVHFDLDDSIPNRIHTPRRRFLNFCD